MSEQMRIDSHKLMFHPDRVADWLKGETIYPLYVEISPTGACNHRCTFCALDYLHYQPHFLDRDLLSARIAEMGQLGVKSIMFGGEGEPLLHRALPDLVEQAKTSGIDVALTTNGVFLTKEAASRIAGATNWIKVSCNAGTPTTYAALHGAPESDFGKVLDNIAAAAAQISHAGNSCTLGVQAILLPENAGELELLAEEIRGAGAAYLVVKAYSQHRYSLNRRYAQVDYTAAEQLAKRLQRFNNDRFQVIFRLHSMEKRAQATRSYRHCLALPFWAYADAQGRVWGCSAFLGDERFFYGSLYEESFAQIWQGQRRAESLAHGTVMSVEECRLNCRMDEINNYLWELTHPHPHVNFI